MNPIEQISEFLDQLKSRNLLAPICLSTINKDGFPNSRFVDLKEVSQGRLYLGTDERSIKAKEFLVNSKVSISAWWEPLELQVRVMGNIERASEELSDKIFATRNRSAKAIATISIQSKTVNNFEEFRT
jgi:pyridoxamine 5'-phosphate oxidase